MDEECLNASKRRKIEDTVLQILKTSDLETITEFSVRSAAAGRLGFELSGLNNRLLVRRLVDSFLLSTAADIVRTESLHRINDGSNTDEKAAYHTNIWPLQQLIDVGIKSVEVEANYNGKVICKLSDKRRVTVYDINKETMVAIRDFHIKDGNMLPEKGANTGISLTATQWSSFRNSFPSIEEAILRLESQSRSVAVSKRSEENVTNSVVDSAMEKSQTEGGISNVRRVVFPPIKRKQSGTEADIRSSVADSPCETSQTKAGISNLVGIAPPHIKSKQIEADKSKAASASNSQEHVLVKRKQEAAGTSGTIPEIRNGTESHISALAPLSPTQRRYDTDNAVFRTNLIPAEGKQIEASISTSLPSFPSEGNLHYTTNAIRPERLIPIQTSRFDGRNYHSWRHQMEFFLNQLNITYVLSEVCPMLSMNPEASLEERIKVKAAAKRWTTDDYMCRHSILNSLCDSLFQLYSQKCYSARELWEELKLVYDDDFGTKRSLINKYIHFQMVDGVSILEQVQELHRIANSVIASGTRIEENLHVSVIVSKLPLTWKDLRVRLMKEEFLPLNMLMHRIWVEEESRNCYRKESNSKKDYAAEPELNSRFGLRKNETKRLCYSCGKEGHILKNCPDKKSESYEKSCGKENGVVSPCAGTKI